ncbi:calcium-binding protein [Bradyrhizobium sp. JYMT SZCCT0428]|uniref:beta strand repeat-containing protein n=1 Tax=Bradyrhizobium sp. JYMT SZCCT0428 TaxID=2807673 RepID=UPI001BA9D4F2|nr:calcium-binding protein [Bradyrhizobium sp. JYMT SZCCT0428]MBR1157041.1 calcium-binding protein [Bradyrhizobium sp. JYMT SZCCT0428]
MATFTRTNAFFTDNWDELTAWNVQASSSTSVTLLNTDGTLTVLTGTGFTFDGSNNALTGTITQAQLFAADTTTLLATIIDVSFALATFQIDANAHTAITGDLLAGNDTLNGGSNTDVLRGGAGNDVFNPGAITFNSVGGGNDIMIGGAGNDTFSIGPSAFQSYSVTYATEGGTNGVTVNTLTGFATDTFGNMDTLGGVTSVTGTNLADTFIGGSINDFFSPGGGNDTIDGGGGAGFDYIGYSTNPLYPDIQLGFPNVAITVTFTSLGAGTVIDPFGNTDTFIGIEGVRGTNFADTYLGSTGNETFRALGGNDTINGGAGFNTSDYSHDAAFGGANAITANLSTGTVIDGFGATDTLINIQQINGTQLADSITGDGNNNTLVGNAGNDTIDGQGGFDFIIGGAGNDSIMGGNEFDTVSYLQETGTNGVTVNLTSGTATDSFGNSDTLASIEQVSGTALADSITGDANNNNLFGEAGNDTLDGQDGNDFITGGAGNDSMIGGNGYDELSYSLDGGTFGIAVTLTAAGVGTATDTFGNTDAFTGIETFTGTGLADTFDGSSSSDSFSPGQGNDTLNGGGGYDNVGYLVDNNATSGVSVNLVIGSVTSGYFGTDLLNGGSFQSVQGTQLADSFIGSSAIEFLQASMGVDTIDGGGGRDTLSYADFRTQQSNVGVIYNASTTVFGSGTVLDAGGSTDTFTNIEVLQGSFYNDSFSGGMTGESFDGLQGNNTYNGATGQLPTVTYLNTHFNGGVSGANVNLATGTGLNPFGGTETFINIHSVEGSVFNDTLIGSAGDDFLAPSNGTDNVDGGGGIDTLAYNDNISAFSIHTFNVTGANSGNVLDGTGTDIFSNIERLRGGFNDDVFNGGTSAMVFEGLGGNNSFNGGSGVETVNYSNDQEVGARENINVTQGVNIDLANSGINSFGGTDTFADIDNAIGSTFADTITGNSLNNSIVGGAGNDTLGGAAGNDTVDGGVGADSMAGGEGDDQYIVDNAGDIVVENGDEGIDGVNLIGNFNYTLGANIEGLSILTGANVSGTGNSLANNLYGGAGNNSLNGGAGADTLVGGLGNDIYFVDNAGDVVTENATEGADTVHTTVTYGLSANTENLILDGSGNITGIGNASANTLTGNTGNNSLYGNGGNDTAYGGDGNDVGVMGNGDELFVGGDGNDYAYLYGGNDTAYGGAGLDVLIGGGGNDLLIGDAGFNYFFGGDGADALFGNGGASAIDVNVMSGEAGNDVLYGGAGTNYFYGGTGVDTMTGGSGLNIFISSGETEGNVINGGLGQNYVYGSNGGDTVSGGAGVDVFLMGTGADFITGGGGVDYAWGGGGTDTFTINDLSSGVMVIQDFNVGGVNDVLNFVGTSLHSFADVQAASFYAAGINTTIITDAAGNAAWLIGKGPGDLDASMFRFG